MISKLKPIRNMDLVKFQIKAFTLIESLITLLVISFLTISLSVSVNYIFHHVEETLFFLRFEYLYRDSQRLASVSQEKIKLQLTSQEISNGLTRLAIPEGVILEEEHQLVFSKQKGNASLAKVTFTSENKQVSYQLYLGSGKYKKTIC